MAALAAQDLAQTKHALRRNFPIIARARYGLEAIGPDLRQYIVTGNDEERPFSRDQRRSVYASSKGENNCFGFGTDNDVENTSYPVVKLSTAPHRWSSPTASPTPSASPSPRSTRSSPPRT